MSLEESQINIHSFCRYLSARDEVKWRNEDYEALFMVKSIKGDDFNGWFELNIGGVVKKFDQYNTAEFKKICHIPLRKIVKKNFSSIATIVPIPSSTTTDESCDRFITYEIGRNLANLCGPDYDCNPLLLFKEKMVSSRKGGSRNPYQIEANYVLKGTTSKRVILLDDVFTLGGHIKAAYWKLTDAGINVLGAVTFAKTVKENSSAAFGPFVDTLDVTKAPMLWD